MAPRPHGPRAQWLHLARALAAPWPRLQRQAGNFPDFTDGLIPGQSGAGTRYGDALLGWALMEQGLRTRSRRLVTAGVKAVTWATRGAYRHDLQRREPSVFEIMAVAGAYNLARTRVPHNRAFRRGQRSWERFIRRAKQVSTILHNPGTTRFSNHYLAEAIATFELARTGVRTSGSEYLVGPGLERAVAIYRDMINRGIPARADAEAARQRRVSAFLLSDPPDYPLAYQGLSTGLYAHAVTLLGRDASPAARSTLRRAANASWLLSAPDGDVAYAGRSMEESWASAGTALAATVAATRGGTSGPAAARYRGVARASLRRLRTAYGPVPGGYAIIPALRSDPVRGARALEQYAGSPSFAGLTLLQVEWLLDELPPGATDTLPLAAGRDGAAILGSGSSQFAVVRSGRTWFAVRAGQSLDRYPGDLRYDFGLVALEHRGRDGAWHDVMPMRPFTGGDRYSAGPVVHSGATVALPWARDLTTASGAATLTGGFGTADGKRLPGAASFRYVATRCGVRVSFPVAAGNSYEYSAFVRTMRRRPHVGRRQVYDDSQRITASPHPDDAVLEREYLYYSATDPRLRRVRMTWYPRRSGTVAIEICAR